jgi:hypothetical protein
MSNPSNCPQMHETEYYDIPALMNRDMVIKYIALPVMGMTSLKK